MKADILRRAEAISDDEDEGGSDVAIEEELDMGTVKVVRDGEESGGDDDDEGDQAQALEKDVDTSVPSQPVPETILELAYIRDPKLFLRDGQTRRSKARAALKAQTGTSSIPQSYRITMIIQL